MFSNGIFTDLLSQIWFRFTLVSLFGFLTGLEFREYLLMRSREQPDLPPISLGSSRTFTFVAMLGYVLFLLDPAYRLYLGGMAVLLVFLGLFYHYRLNNGQTGLLQPLIVLLVYTYGPIVSLQPPWFLILVFVALVFALGARKKVHLIAETVEPAEMQTLARFLLLSGVVLPLLPDKPVSAYVPVTPFRIWLAVVVISGISYIGYILKKYFFKRRGYLIAGLLGGLYSSTAATVVLARKTRHGTPRDPSPAAGIVAATGMMYLRLLLLIGVMNIRLLPPLAVPLLGLGLAAIFLAFLMDRRAAMTADALPDLERSNPLELGVALLFALVFVIMLVVTRQVIELFGNTGLEILSVLMGITDIDPFILSILSGQYQLTGEAQLAGAILMAAGSNNLLKAVYALILGKRRAVATAVALLCAFALATMAYYLFVLRGGSQDAGMAAKWYATPAPSEGFLT